MLSRIIRSILFILAISGLFVACNSNGPASDSPLEEGAEQVVEETADAFRTDREELQADLKETKEAIDENIKPLKDKMEITTDGAEKVELEKQIDALKRFNDQLGAQLKALTEIETEAEFKRFEKEARMMLTQVRQRMVDVE